MRCSNLRELTLQACFFDLAAFSRLLNGVVPRLRKLTMPNLVEPWTRPTQASVADLQQINLGSMSQVMPVSWFQPFSKLTHVELGCPTCSAQEIAETLIACPRLTSLSLIAAGSTLVFDVAQHLRESFEQLHKLQLHDSFLTKDDGIALMQACCSRTTLDAWNTTVEDGQMSEIVCASPQLRELEVGLEEMVPASARPTSSLSGNTQILLVKLDMANIDDLTDVSVSAMQKLTSLVDLSLLYCLDYPLSGEALHELVQACPLLSTLTLHSAERRTLTRKTVSRTFSRACFPVAQRCWRSGTVLEERGGALEIGRWRGGGFVELGSLAKTKYSAGFLPPACLPQAGA